MAIETIRKSDASGKEIPPGTGARIRVIFNDPKRVDLRADLTDDEVEQLLSWAKAVVPRPRVARGEVGDRCRGGGRRARRPAGQHGGERGLPAMATAIRLPAPRRRGRVSIGAVRARRSW